MNIVQIFELYHQIELSNYEVNLNLLIRFYHSPNMWLTKGESLSGFRGGSVRRNFYIKKTHKFQKMFFQAFRSIMGEDKQIENYLLKIKSPTKNKFLILQ